MTESCGCAQCARPPLWQRESHPDFDTVFSMLRQDGFQEEDRDRPVVGVCNTWNEVVPGHLHLRDLADRVKLGVRAAGGAGLEFGCVAPCDGFGNANRGYRYILPMRDHIADAVELMAEAHHFDGMVLISSCDKSNPGVMMGLARVNRPAIFLGGGMGHRMCPGEGLGTAMSMQCLAEALGLALPRTATTYATGTDHRQLSMQAGKQIVELVRSDIKPADILTPAAFRNAVRVNMAIGGSYNTFIHLPGIAYEAGVGLTPADFDHLSDTTPYLCSIAPNGPCVLSQLDAMGGIPAVMKVLEPLLDLDVMTVTGRTLGENLNDVHLDWSRLPHPDVLRPLDNPCRPTGGLTVLRGNLAPQGAVIRSAGVLPTMLRFEGPARVFDCEHDAMAAVARHQYEAGEVLIIRNEGIVGGPGMPEQSCVGWTLDRQGMYDKVYLVTDGRYSGACHGPLVGLVTPEAVMGGPIAVVRNGDLVRIDVTAKKLDVLIPEEEIQRRLQRWRPPQPRVQRGFLSRYARRVVPALQGGYLPHESGTPEGVRSGNESSAVQTAEPASPAAGGGIAAAPRPKKTIVTVASTTPEYTRKGEGDVVELDDGRLLLVYMEFRGDGSDFAPTRIVAKESADGGLSWNGHRVITETRPGDVNVYSPNLLRARDGGILLVFMRKHTVEPTSTTLYVWKSDASGAAFAPYAEIAAGGYFGLCNAVIERLQDGRLLLPVSGPRGLIGEGGDAPSSAVAVLFSDDDGISWQDPGSRSCLPMRGAMEPHVTETGDGRVLMVMRNQLGSLFLAESLDAGVSWSKPRSSGLQTPESCPELKRIPSTSDLLMIWNNSPYDPDFASHYGQRSPLTAAVSRDGGCTWTHRRDIETDPTRAFSNPGCRFTATDRAVINYWTCEYTPEWRMQDVIDLRVAVIDTGWFYST